MAVYLRVRSVGADQGTALRESGDADTVVAASSTDPLASATSTITLVPNATSAAGAPVRSRDVRYDELLRTPSPPGAAAAAAAAPASSAAPPAAAKRPSLLERVASAIGLGDRKAAPSPAQPAPSRTSPGAQASAQRPGGTEPEAQKKPAEELDPESDTQPPQLLGLQFNPPQVQDGEATTLSISAQDNLSGIRTISGVIANPTGATVSGFAAQLEPESNRYVARIPVPKDAAEGNWHIKYLTMSDKAANSVNLAYGQGLAPMLATFRVTSSRSDAKGPELKALWIDKRGMAAGEKNTIFATVEDDKAGVQIVSGVFVSPSKVARLGFGCRAGSTGAWECTLAVPECVDCGTWQLEQLQMQDKANNTTTVRADNQMVSAIQVDISGDRCDGAPPVLTSLSLNPTVVSNQAVSVVSVVATVQDDNCGGATLSGLATGPQGQRLNILFDPSKDGQHFTGRIEVAQNQARGTYTVAWIQALDKGQNLRAYSASDPVVGRVTFRVE